MKLIEPETASTEDPTCSCMESRKVRLLGGETGKGYGREL